MKKLQFIDALRGIAIIGVIMIHCPHGGEAYPVPSFIYNFIEAGGRGVQLFFVASAFTLFLSMSRQKEGEKYPNLNFAIRRYFRIAPIYYIGIVTYLIFPDEAKDFWAKGGVKTIDVLANVAFIQGFNPLWTNSVVTGGWSIGTEMLFYCLVPFLFSRIKNMNQAVTFFAISLIFNRVLSDLILYFSPHPSPFFTRSYLYSYLPSQLPVFALGFILYFLIVRTMSENKVGIAPIAALATMVAVDLIFKKPLFFIQHVVFSIAFVALAYILSVKEYKIAVNAITKSVGIVSFGMYISHFAVIDVLIKLKLTTLIAGSGTVVNVGNYLITFILALLGTFAVSWVLYRLVEVPFQNLGKKLIKKLDGDGSTKLQTASW